MEKLPVADGDIALVRRGQGTELCEVVITSPVVYMRPINDDLSDNKLTIHKVVPRDSGAFKNKTVVCKRRVGEIVPVGVSLKDFITK